jgi:hypothetical protein
LVDGRLDVVLAVVEAHLLFVEGAPLEGGGRDPQPKASLQRACVHARVHLASARVDPTGARGRRKAPPGAPRALNDTREARPRAWGDGFPPLGIPYCWGGASEGGVQGGKPRRGGAARPLPPQATADRVGGG